MIYIQCWFGPQLFSNTVRWSEVPDVESFIENWDYWTLRVLVWNIRYIVENMIFYKIHFALISTLTFCDESVHIWNRWPCSIRRSAVGTFCIFLAFSGLFFDLANFMLRCLKVIMINLVDSYFWQTSNTANKLGWKQQRPAGKQISIWRRYVWLLTEILTEG